MTLVCAGMLLFTTVEVNTEYWRIAITFFLLGVGMGLTMAPSTTLGMNGAFTDAEIREAVKTARASDSVLREEIGRAHV